MSNRVALGKAVKAIREAKHIPLGKAAADALMSTPHLANIEAGRRRATDESIELIAKALAVEVDAISYLAPTGAVA